MTYYEQQLAKERAKAQARREREADKLTAYLCHPCREANKTKSTHPGAQHEAGICDCPCAAFRR